MTASWLKLTLFFSNLASKIASYFPFSFHFRPRKDKKPSHVCLKVIFIQRNETLFATFFFVKKHHIANMNVNEELRALLCHVEFQVDFFVFFKSAWIFAHVLQI